MTKKKNEMKKNNEAILILGGLMFSRTISENRVNKHFRFNVF